MKLSKLKLFEIVRFSALASALAFVFSAVTVDAQVTNAKKARAKIVKKAQTSVKVSTTNTNETDWDAVAPFVNSQTPFVVRVDLAGIDLDQTGESLKRLFDGYLDVAGFDDDSKERCAEAFDKTVSSAVATFKTSLAMFCDGAPLSKIYFVGFLTDDSIQFVGVVPTKDKSDEEREKLRELASRLHFELYERGANFIFSPSLDEEELDELLNGFKAEPNPAIQEYFDGAKATVAAYVAKFPLEKILTENGVELDEAFDAAEKDGVPIRPVWNLCKESFESAELSLDINELTASASVTFADAGSASDARKELESLIDASTIAVVKATRENMDREQSQLMGNFGLFDLSRELARATIRKAFLPRVEGNRLVGDATDGAFFAFAGPAVGLLLPAVSSARGAARRMQCTNNLKQIMLAVHNYHDVQNSFPPVGTVDRDGKPMHSWRVYLLPFLNETALYNKIRLNEPWDSEWNSQFHSQTPDVYRCPDDKDAPDGTTRYSFVVGEQTPFTKRPSVTENGALSTKGLPGLAFVVDGTSNTICVVERKKAVCWMDPTNEFNIESLENGFDVSKDDCLWSAHKGGANVGMIDGSVRFITETISPKLLKAMGTANGGESFVYPID